jgi:hypothetical protein
MINVDTSAEQATANIATAKATLSDKLRGSAAFIRSGGFTSGQDDGWFAGAIDHHASEAAALLAESNALSAVRDALGHALLDAKTKAEAAHARAEQAANQAAAMLPARIAAERQRDLAVAALAKAAARFDLYANHHDAKGTPESASKAETNRSMAGLCRGAIVASGGPPKADLFWDADHWECTAEERGHVTDELPCLEVMALGRAVKLPPIFLVRTPIGEDGEDGDELMEFATRAEAEAFIADYKAPAEDPST